MRIVIGTDSFYPRVDGVADTAAIAARILSQRGHDVLVIAPAPGPRHVHGARVMRIPSLPLPLYAGFRMAAPTPPLVRVLRNESVDAALVLTSGPIGLGVVAALPSRTPMVHVYTTDLASYAGVYRLGILGAPVNRVLRWMSRRAVATLCPTEFVRARLAIQDFERLRVWGRGVDQELFRPERRDAEMRWRLSGGEPEKPLVLFVGRLAREKRILDLYEAALQVPGVRFALVGDGPQRDLLERRFAEVPSVFTGFLRGTTLARAFASADVFVMPSETETFGQVVVQAMASGLPAIVVRGTAPAEFVPAGVAGLHVPPRSPQAIAEAIYLLISDDDLRRSMAAAATLQASRHSWPALIDELELMLGDSGRSPESIQAPASAGEKPAGVQTFPPVSSAQE